MAAAARLEQLLLGDDRPAPAEVEAAGQALLAALAEAPVGAVTQTEHWLLPLLHQSILRSDPIFPAAAGQFGWDDAARIGRVHAFELNDLFDRQAARQLVEHDLDPATLAWWRAYFFEGRHLPDGFWVDMLFPPAGFVMSFSRNGVIGRDGRALGSALAAAAIAIFASLRIAFAWPRDGSRRA